MSSSRIYRSRRESHNSQHQPKQNKTQVNQTDCKWMIKAWLLQQDRNPPHRWHFPLVGTTQHLGWKLQLFTEALTQTAPPVSPQLKSVHITRTSWNIHAKSYRVQIPGLRRYGTMAFPPQNLILPHSAHRCSRSSLLETYHFFFHFFFTICFFLLPSSFVTVSWKARRGRFSCRDANTTAVTADERRERQKDSPKKKKKKTSLRLERFIKRGEPGKQKATPFGS